MNAVLSHIDRGIGAVLRQVGASRGDDLRRAAETARMSPDELDAVMDGQRRLRAVEMMVLSTQLSIPVGDFFRDTPAELSEQGEARV